MRRQLLPALRMLAVLTVALGLAYPLAVTGVAQALFRGPANGSLAKVDGKVVGSKLLGQDFTSARYFQGRPSAAGATAAGALDENGKPADPDDLSLSNSGGSNLGPSSADLQKAVAQRVADYRRANGLAADEVVPVDAVTSSASGVDPEISVANARLQASRVARVRGMPVARVDALVDRYTSTRSFGFLGAPGVNVLELNLALDRIAGS